jgi:hypothetical protein
VSALGLTRLRFVSHSASDGIFESALATLVTKSGFDTDAYSSATSRDYEALAEELDARTPNELLHTTCVVDLTAEPLQVWSTLDRSHSMRPASLVWRYPEIYWIFVVADNDLKDLRLPPDTVALHFVSSDEYGRLQQLLLRHARGLRTWFDPGYLRRSAASDEIAASLTLRGLVLDEELTFATFNGYLLHRQGIATRIVPTAAEFNETKAIAEQGGRLVILEDLELVFADRDPELPSALLYPIAGAKEDTIKARADFWCLTPQRVAARIFVSSSLVPGQHSVIKPFGGMYERDIRTRIGTATPFPIREATLGSHSAAGEHQLVAARLLGRARMLESAGTVSAIHGALLALCAQQLLGNKTYALSLESMTLRHAFEVRAECGFPGASGDLEIAARVAELRSSVNQLVFKEPGALGILAQLVPKAPEAQANWARLYKRNVQVTNGLLESLGVLREIFADYKRLEEEEYVLQQVRRLRIRAFLGKRSLTGTPTFSDASGLKAGATRLARACANVAETVVRSLLSIPRLYVVTLLNPLVLVFTTVAWIVGFGFCFNAWDQLYKPHTHAAPSLYEWIRHSAVAFLAFGDPKAPGLTDELLAASKGYGSYWDITVTEMGLGYLHLALLVAVLVQRITRR